MVVVICWWETFNIIEEKSMETVLGLKDSTGEQKRWYTVETAYMKEIDWWKGETVKEMKWNEQCDMIKNYFIWNTLTTFLASLIIIIIIVHSWIVVNGCNWLRDVEFNSVDGGDNWRGCSWSKFHVAIDWACNICLCIVDRDNWRLVQCVFITLLMRDCNEDN